MYCNICNVTGIFLIYPVKRNSFVIHRNTLEYTHSTNVEIMHMIMRRIVDEKCCCVDFIKEDNGIYFLYSCHMHCT